MLYLVHACSSCPILFPDAFVTGICLLILRCFFSGCTLLARRNAAHLFRPKGALGQKFIHSSLIRWHAARRHRASPGRHAACGCPRAPAPPAPAPPAPPAPPVPAPPAPPAPAPPAPPAPRTCVSKSCYFALNHEAVLVVEKSCDGSLEARMRSQAVDVDIVMKIGYTTFHTSSRPVFERSAIKETHVN
jgi:hypothetical protein